MATGGAADANALAEEVRDCVLETFQRSFAPWRKGQKKGNKTNLRSEHGSQRSPPFKGIVVFLVAVFGVGWYLGFGK